METKTFKDDKRVIVYCKKQINSKEWDERYSQNPMYMSLSVPKEEGRWVAFTRVCVNDEKLPDNIIPLNADEMRQFDKYRESNNVLPDCFERVDNLAIQKINNCHSLQDLKEVWEMFNTATKLVGIIRERKEERKKEFQELGI